MTTCTLGARHNLKVFAGFIAHEYQCWSSEESGLVLASVTRMVADSIEDDREREAFLSDATMSGLAV